MGAGGKRGWALGGRVAVAVGVLGVALWRAVGTYAGVVAAGGADHQTGDWLINYGGGFVRRGLAGELLLRLTGPGQGALWALFGVQVALYGVVVLFCLDQLVRHRFSWGSVVLLCGPAALAFAGWDPSGAFRKEIIVFAALALLGWVRVGDGNRARDNLLTIAAVVLYALAVFSWEGSAFLLPAVLWLVLVVERGSTEPPARGPVAAVFTAITAVGLWASWAARGDAATSAAVCAAVRAHGIGTGTICDGAIRWLGVDAASGLAVARAYWPAQAWLLPLAGLGLLGLLTTRWARRYWPWVVASLVAVAPLFVLAIDYGRWVHMVVLALAMCAAASEIPLDDGPWTPPGAVVYLTAWGLPHSVVPVVPWLGFWHSVVALALRSWSGG